MPLPAGPPKGRVWRPQQAASSGPSVMGCAGARPSAQPLGSSFYNSICMSPSLGSEKQDSSVIVPQRGQVGKNSVLLSGMPARKPGHREGGVAGLGRHGGLKSMECSHVPPPQRGPLLQTSSCPPGRGQLTQPSQSARRPPPTSRAHSAQRRVMLSHSLFPGENLTVSGNGTLPIVSTTAPHCSTPPRTQAPRWCETPSAFHRTLVVLMQVTDTLSIQKHHTGLHPKNSIILMSQEL